MSEICFGVDLGGTTIKIGLFDSEKGMLDKWEIPTRKENNGSLILDDIANFIKKKMVEGSYRTENISGVGIGVPGPVLPDGRIERCVNLGWENVYVGKILSEKLGLPVIAANDANVAALGEMWKGGGKGYQNLVMITLGTGVGGGIILNGKIVPGVNGAAGELGHLPVVYDETDKCNCGKCGCLEQIASATGIVKQAKKILEATEEPSKLRERKHLSAKEIFDAAKQGDKLASMAVDKLSLYLGIALAHVSGVIDPEIFVIGGGVSKAGTVLIESIQKYYKEKVYAGCRDSKFSLAELGNDAGMYGAAKMILDK